MKTTKEIKMSGQEKYISGFELRWVIRGGSEETCPAKVTDSNGKDAYVGTYAGAMKWLADRNLRPCGQ